MSTTPRLCGPLGERFANGSRAKEQLPADAQARQSPLLGFTQEPVPRQSQDRGEPIDAA